MPSGPEYEVKHDVFVEEGTILLVFVKMEFKNEADHMAKALVELDCEPDIPS